jgi:hypothetical protein
MAVIHRDHWHDSRFVAPLGGSHHPEMTEGSLDCRTPRRRTRVDTLWVIKPVDSSAANQSAVGFNMRNPRGLRNEPACGTNPMLYLSVGRHHVQLSNRRASRIHERTNYTFCAGTIKANRILADLGIAADRRLQSSAYAIHGYPARRQAILREAATQHHDSLERVTRYEQTEKQVGSVSTSRPSSRRKCA